MESQIYGTKKEVHIPLQQYHNAQKNNKTSILSPQNIDIQASNRSIINTDSSIKLLERDSQTTIVDCDDNIQQQSLHDIYERNSYQFFIVRFQRIQKNRSKIFGLAQQKIQNQRRQKILQTQLRQSQN